MFKFGFLLAMAMAVYAVPPTPQPVNYEPVMIDTFERLGDFPDLSVREGWVETLEEPVLNTYINRGCAYGESTGGLYMNDLTSKSSPAGWAYCMDYDIKEYPDKVGVYVRSLEQGGKAYLGFWASKEGAYSLVLDFTDCNNKLQVQNNHGWGFQVLAEIPLHSADPEEQNVLTDEDWYYMEVEFLPSGKVVGSVFWVGEAEGDSPVVPAEPEFIDSIAVDCGGPYDAKSCGVALRGHRQKCFDDIQTCQPTTVVGDPHFTGFDGSTYDLQGRAGSVYNILSDYNLQVNSRYRAGCRPGATLMAEFGVMYKHNRIDISTVRVRFNGDKVEPSQEMIKLDTTGDEYLQVLDEDHAVLVLNDYILAFHSVKVRCGGKRIDMKITNRNPGSRPHGILGQTLRHEDRDKSRSTPWNHQGQGVISGRHSDYEVTHLFANDFKYNQFGDAANADHKALRRPMHHEEQMGKRDVAPGEDTLDE